MPDLYFVIEYPIFRDFEADDVDALGSLCEEKNLPAGAYLFRENEPGDAMCIVKQGVLNVSKVINGETKHVNILNAGEFCGEMALIDGSPRSANITAKEDTAVIVLSCEAYKRLRKEHPATALKIADVLLKTLSFRLRRSTRRAVESDPAPTPPAANAATTGSAPALAGPAQEKRANRAGRAVKKKKAKKKKKTAGRRRSKARRSRS
jgi:CRP/FNR family transcriptional regulator, cyclic AMP receptor protein